MTTVYNILYITINLSTNCKLRTGRIINFFIIRIVGAFQYNKLPFLNPKIPPIFKLNDLHPLKLIFTMLLILSDSFQLLC